MKAARRIARWLRMENQDSTWFTTIAFSGGFAYKPTTSRDLPLQQRVPTERESSGAMGLEASIPPDPVHRGVASTDLRGQAAGAPVGTAVTRPV